MRELRGGPVGLVLLLALGAGCQKDQPVERASPSMLADSAIVASLKDPPTPGRLIYDAAPDLSYASAQRTRRDLVRGDTIVRKTEGSQVQRPRP